jgi:hypothetical protein
VSTMYPITCAGGYPIPIKKGRFKICGLVVTVDDTTAASRCTLVDSAEFKELTDDQTLKPVLVDLKGLPNAEGVMGIMFPAPIQVRDGVTVSNLSNVLAGRTIVYIQ